MDQAVITDLKQFIGRTVAESEQRVNKRIDDLDERLNRKIDDLAASVADALDGSNEVIEARINNHERRIARLERKQSL